MKLWRVDFLLHTIMRVLILCTISLTYGQSKEQTSLSQKQLDNITQHYTLSNVDSLSLSQRLYHVSSFLKGAKLSQQDSLVYKGLRQKTWLLSKSKQFDSAIIYSHELYDLARQNKDTFFITNALTKLGFYNKKNSELAESFKYYNEGFKISKISKDSINMGRSLLQMANIQASLGDYSGSKTTAVDGVVYLEKTTDLRNLGGLYHIISVAHIEQKKYEEAFRYNDLALSLGKDSLSAKRIGIKNILVFRNTKANILAKQGKYQKALTILKELVSDPVVQNDRWEYARVIDNLGYIQWLEDEKNENSEQLLLNAKKIREEINDIQGLIASNIHLTKYYFKNDKIKASEYAEGAYQNAKGHRTLTSILEALDFVFKFKENTNEEAKVYSRIHKELEEANQNNREIYAVTRYENDKLANKILVLDAQKAQQESETARQRSQKIMYLLGTVILALSGGFVFYLLQQRYKREKIREVYDAETRISKKLHDELANDVYNVMVQIQNEQNSPDVLDKLEEIYNTTRDISREHNSFTTGENYAAELTNMLSGYSSNETKIIIKDIEDVNWESVDPEKKIIVHRTLQELMINMKKHSEAGLVAVTFKKTLKNVGITYADNGIGVSENEIIHSNGLRNAENRIKTIGGSFIFDSEKGKGFRARISFPN
ncbi:tetratricopeptide repeat protein [Aquimarina algiphila]|uniref:histidine kinase n=1 Tax=Aquimarina algiphila TaxID=2047982 RepID=A0A554VJN4_9FLAO|nr:tetratricopeptide repeat protein [Aquimarina algiphila]TSE08091.1 tetratricopeptide repeat protein [Aquimarina algiphila]